ncbi:MAG: class I SAM-dependent methyltransferase [Nanoarchaeota archaeon]|nr:class I SAM-dependent methyltransferase [Nanoarchaeota archaeon]
MNFKKIFCGNERERMPDIAFRMMSFIFKICDIFSSVDKRIDYFGIKEGFTVIDYGCGPGRYLKRASQLVGGRGRVYAADIHKLAIESVKKRIEKYNLKNVEPILTKGYFCSIDEHAADVIYALDMFHMIKEPDLFLKELHRLLKRGGYLIIEDGHQPRNKTKSKINNSKIWKISEETKGHLKCKPL